MYYSQNEKIGPQVSEPLISSLNPDDFDDSFSRLCSICNQTQQSLISLSQCLHHFCHPCIESFIFSKLSLSQTLLTCPQCPLFIHPKQIQNISSEKTKNRYLTLCCLNPILINCPKVNCEGFAIVNIDSNEITCNKCLQNFCFYCRKSQHFNYICRFIDDSCLDEWLCQSQAKFCPDCYFFYIRDEPGCPLTQCINCECKWCWYCGSKFTTADHQCDAIKPEPATKKKNAKKFGKKKIERFLLALFSSVIFILFPLWTCLDYVKKCEDGEKNWAIWLFRVFKFRFVVYLLAGIFAVLVWPVGILMIGFKCGKSFFYSVFCYENKSLEKKRVLDIVFFPALAALGLLGCVLFVVISTLFAPFSLILNFDSNVFVSDEALVRSLSIT